MAAENEYAAASYVLELYRQIETLNLSLSSYRLSLKFFDTRFSQDKDRKFFTIQEQEEINFRQQIINFHNLTNLVYIKLRAMRETIPALQKNEKEFDDLYDKLQTELFPDRKDAADFVYRVNSYFVDGLAQTLFQSAHQVYRSYVSDNETQ